MFKYTPQQQVPHNQEQSLPGQAALLPEKHNVGHMRGSISRTNRVQNYDDQPHTNRNYPHYSINIALISFQNATSNY